MWWLQLFGLAGFAVLLTGALIITLRAAERQRGAVLWLVVGAIALAIGIYMLVVTA
jgi:hypothetical protein